MGQEAYAKSQDQIMKLKMEHSAKDARSSEMEQKMFLMKSEVDRHQSSSVMSVEMRASHDKVHAEMNEIQALLASRDFKDVETANHVAALRAQVEGLKATL